MAGRLRTGVLALALVGVLGAAGCTNSDDPPATPSPTTSASSAGPTESPSSSPSPTTSATASDGPEIPAAARKQTPEGAEAFVEFFFTQFNIAWTKPQPGLIESLSDPECQFCNRGEAGASDLASHGERYASDPVTIENTASFGGAPTNEQFIEIQHVQNSVDIITSDGAVVSSDPRDENDFYVTLRWTEGQWRLLEMERT